ncbi:ankyrin repeat-containing domain protein, partial [Mycena olivaceomarginata]
KTLQQMNNPLTTFKSTMEQFTKGLEPSDGRLSKVAKRLTWTMGNKSEAKEYLGKFEQFKSLLNSWLLLDISDIGQREHSEILTTIDDVTHDQHQQMKVAQRGEIIDWLSPINFFLRQADIASARQPGTGEWIIADSRFQRWEYGSGGTLWCHGIPGAGKTVLAAMVVAHLNVQSRDRNIGVACIYLNHKETTIQTPGNLLAGLWRQLILGKNLPPIVQTFTSRPSLDEIHAVLRSAITEWSKVYFVVDALDEYSEDQRRILLEQLASMGPTVSLMLTSRPHLVLDDFLATHETLEIRAREDDIQKYVDAQIGLSSRLSKHVGTQPELRGEIQSKISGTVDGMFLMAKLHIETLSTKSTIKAVRAALHELPKDLEHTYEAVMQRIDSQNEDDKQIAHSTLTWVTNSKRALRVPELQEALGIEPGTHTLDCNNLLDIEIILSVCAGLVIIDETSYFDSIQAKRFPNAQVEITSSLLTFLAFDDFKHLSHLDERTEPGQYSLVHAAGKPEIQLRDMVVKLLERAVEWKDTWSWGPRVLWWDWPSNPSTLWVAAASDLLETARHLLKRGMSREEKSLSLQVAAQCGHISMVQLLIAKGADVNARVGYYGSALHIAVTLGHHDITRLLITEGADVNVQGGEYGSVLQSAVSWDDEDIVRVLIEKGADVNAQFGEHGSALELAAASYSCQEDLVRFLIDKGANVDAHGGEYGGALQAASGRGYTVIARLLVEAGADVNAVGGEYGGALQAAVANGHEDIFRLLIAEGADVNVQVGYHGTILEVAATSRREGLVHLLIAAGADVNAGTYGSVLQAVLRDIIRILIENGADPNTYGSPLQDEGVDVNVQGGEYDTVLQSAAACGDEDMVRFLIEKGADVNAQGGAYGSALQAASGWGHQGIVQLLIAKGADLQTNDNEDLIRLLIEQGGNVKAQGGIYGSALQAASSFGYTDVVQLLIAKGLKPFPFPFICAGA